MNGAPATTDRRLGPDKTEAAFRQWLRQLVKGAAELEAFDAGEIDAVMDRDSGSAVLLPEAQTALQLDLERQRAALTLNTRDDAARDVVSGEHQTEVRRLRSGNGTDSATPSVKRRAGSVAAKSRGNGNGNGHERVRRGS